MLVILLVYFVFFVVWAVGSVVAIYQSMKYLEPNTKIKLGLNTYVWLCVVILLLSFYFLYGIDWANKISLKL